MYYVTIVHILVLQSDSGFGSDIPPPTEYVSNDDERQRPVYIHEEPTKELGEYHGNSLLLQNSSQGLISGHLSVGSECFHSRPEIQCTYTLTVLNHYRHFVASY